MTKEEAIRRIKSWNLDSDDMEVLSAVIPELKESDEERIRKDIVALIKFALEDGSAVSPGSHTTKEEALAYLEEQKQEWGEEDEKMLASFLHKVEVCDLLSNKENVWIVKRLKSIRPQSHWKPSEEQMCYLKKVYESYYYCDGERTALESLYNDLQKLL